MSKEKPVIVNKKTHPPVSGPLADLEKWLYDLLVVRAPFQLPKEATDWIVRYGPWIALIVGVLMLPLVLTALTLAGIVGTVMTALVPFTGYSGVGIWFWLAFVALVAEIVVMFVSIPMLLKRQRNGWLLLLYADLANLIYGLFTAFDHGFGSLVGTLVGTIIGFYILFQIRHYYDK